MHKAILVLGLFVIAVLVGMGGFVSWANIRIIKDEVTPARDGARGRFLEVNGHEWHVVTRGELHDPRAVPVLLVHGFSAAGQLMWNPITKRLAPHRALILPDMLGYGHSAHITSPGPYYSIGSYVASLAEMLDKLGVRRVDLVGHSFGGAIAARFALDYPQRVRRVVFIDAAVYYEKRPFLDGLTQWPLGIGRAITWTVAGAGPLSPLARYCEGQKSEECWQLLRAKDTTNTTLAMMYTYHHSPDAAELVGNLPKISAPALVIWGANDPFFPAAQGKRLADTLRAHLVLVSDGFHMPFVYKPREVTDTILSFLAQGQD